MFLCGWLIILTKQAPPTFDAAALAAQGTFFAAVLLGAVNAEVVAAALFPEADVTRMTIMMMIPASDRHQVHTAQLE